MGFVGLTALPRDFELSRHRARRSDQNGTGCPAYQLRGDAAHEQAPEKPGAMAPGGNELRTHPVGKPEDFRRRFTFQEVQFDSNLSGCREFPSQSVELRAGACMIGLDPRRPGHRWHLRKRPPEDVCQMDLCTRGHQADRAEGGITAEAAEIHGYDSGARRRV